MKTNGRIGQYIGFNAWNITTSQGATIQTALDYAMTIDASSSNETLYANELYPNVAAVATIYGDPSGKYAKYLAKFVCFQQLHRVMELMESCSADPTYPTQPYFAYNLLSASGLVQPDGSPLPNTTSKNEGSRHGGELSRYQYFSGLFGLITFSVLI